MKTVVWILTITVVAAVVLGAIFYTMHMFAPHYPWLFKGAYAEYRGKTMMGFLPVSMKLCFEVLDYNSTHIKLLEYMEFESIGYRNETTNTEWIPIKEFIKPTGKKLIVFNQTIYIEGLGARECTVYKNVDEKGEETFVYIDKKAQFPIRIEYFTKDYHITLTITKSNIPGITLDNG